MYSKVVAVCVGGLSIAITNYLLCFVASLPPLSCRIATKDQMFHGPVVEPFQDVCQGSHGSIMLPNVCCGIRLVHSWVRSGCVRQRASELGRCVAGTASCNRDEVRKQPLRRLSWIGRSALA